MDPAGLTRIAATQRGVFTRAQARAQGMSDFRIRHRVRTGRWSVVFGTVLTARPGPLAPEQRDVAAALARPGSVLAGPSAARAHGMPVRDPGTYLWIGTRRVGPLAGVRYLRDPQWPRDTSPGAVVPVTTPERTVIDCLRLLPDDEALALVDRALQQEWITVGRLAARVRYLTGRHGVTRLVRMVSLARAGAHSAAERIAHGLLTSAGIRGWEANQRLHDRSGLIGVGDIVFDRAKIVVEIDGRAHHVTPDRFERDRSRQNRLVAAGSTVLRFTWRDLTEHPDRFVTLVRSMLAR